MFSPKIIVFVFAERTLLQIKNNLYDYQIQFQEKVVWNNICCCSWGRVPSEIKTLRAKES
jgi:hypothetical protein